ncbi:MAG TPA: DMT family transporter [Stellaceae bacterium]|nr:DMT family transporter [Stellaceae bacterium]
MLSLAVIARRFDALPPIARAAFWVVLSGFCATFMNVFVREAARELHPFEITFFRCFFGFAVLVPWIVKAGPGALKTRKKVFYTLRGLVSLVSMLSWFYGITLVPLATATALNFTSPLFSTLGAALVLHESVRLRRWSALAVGFVGVIVILRPGAEALDPYALLIIFSAMTGGLNVVTVKFLARTESPAAIVTYLMLFLTPLSLIPALFVWQWPSLVAIGWLVALGALGTLSHISVVRGYGLVDASACAPFEFLRLPFAAFMGYVLFSEVTDLWTWVGAVAIAVSAIYVAHREARIARERAPASPPAATLSAREPLPRA